jgi:hypothetical protein
MRASFILSATFLSSCLAAPLYTLDPVWPKGLSGLNVSTVTAVACVRATPSSPAEVIVAQRGTALPFFLVFDADQGLLKRSWGPAGVQSPHGMFWSPSLPGSLFVTDIANATVYEFDASSDGRSVLGRMGVNGVHGAGTKPMQFSAPADVAVTSRGSVLVSDGDGGSDNRVSSLSRAPSYGDLIWTVGAGGSAPADFSSPHSVAYLAGTDMAVVADRGNNRVKFLAASTGALLGAWGAECFNATNATIGVPWGVRVDSRRGRLLVADGAHGALYVLRVGNGDGWSTDSVPSCDGALVDTLPAPKADSKPHEMAVDEVSGDIYLACVGTAGEEGTTSIVRYTPTA